MKYHNYLKVFLKSMVLFLELPILAQAVYLGDVKRDPCLENCSGKRTPKHHLNSRAQVPSAARKSKGVMEKD